MALFSFTVTVLALAIPETVHAQSLEVRAVLAGIANVKDGDGVLFGDVEVRLQGIAAPEDRTDAHEPGGSEATESLKNLINGKFITCHLDGTVAGSSNRPVGICYFNGLDIGLYQIRAGFARDCPRYSLGRYLSAETEAKAEGLDLSASYSLPEYCVSKNDN